MRRRGTRPLLVTVLVTLLVSGAVLLAAPGRATAAVGQDPPTTTPTTVPTSEGENPSAPEQDIIPRPDSGVEPDDAGDRGGALQLAVLAAIVVGVSAVVALAVRESRRQRRARQAAGETGDARQGDNEPYSSQPG